MQSALQPLRHGEQHGFVEDRSLAHAGDGSRHFRRHVWAGRGPGPRVLAGVSLASFQARGLQLRLPARPEHGEQLVRDLALRVGPEILFAEAVAAQGPRKLC